MKDEPLSDYVQVGLWLGLPRPVTSISQQVVPKPRRGGTF